MSTYCRWKNSHPRDYKIDDAAMLRFVCLLIAMPIAVALVWVHALYEGGRSLARGRIIEALAYIVLTPFFTIGEAPGYFRARWNSITG